MSSVRSSSKNFEITPRRCQMVPLTELTMVRNLISLRRVWVSFTGSMICLRTSFWVMYWMIFIRGFREACLAVPESSILKNLMQES